MGLPRFWIRPRRDRELSRELESYLEHETAAGVSAGLSEREAAARARRKLGSPVRVHEDVRALYSLGPIEAFAKDLRYALRLLRGSRGFTLAAVVSLALGIGANTAIFQVLNAVRLRALPVPRPGELVEVAPEGGTRGFGITNSTYAQMTYPLWDELRRQQRAFSGLFAWGQAEFEEDRRGTSHRVRGLWVSGNLFEVLGVPPFRGRLIGPADDVAGCGAGPVVISHAYWQRELGGDEQVIGRAVVLDDRTFHVAGITPPGFFGFEVGSRFDVAVPICAAGVWDPHVLEQRNLWWLVAMGRLLPGWSIPRASAHLAGLSPGLLAATIPSGYDEATLATWRRMRLKAQSASRGISQWRAQYEASLWLLLGLTGLVLVLTCANLANLLLARASAREREFAVRVAIGASRRRLLSQCLAESAILALAGAIAGTWLARTGSQLLVSFVSTDAKPLLLDVGTDVRVLAFTSGVTVLTCLGCGLVPAWRASRTEPQLTMKAGARGVTGGPARFAFQRWLVAMQVAVSVVLVVGALLFARSLRNLMTVDAGFRKDDIVFSILGLSDGSDAPDASRVQLARQRVLEGVRAIPQVDAAATSTHLPLSNMSWGFSVRVPSAHGERAGDARFVWVSPGYFRTMGVRLLSGRDVDDHDVAASRRVTVVNETFVRRYLDGQRVIGAQVRSLAEPGYPATTFEVIGTVADTKYASLRDQPQAIAFLPVAQHPSPDRWAWTVVAMRTTAPIAVLKPAIERVVTAAGVRSDVVLWPFRTQVRDGLLRERLMGWLSSLFGVLALLLAAVGIYGVVAYGVSRRTNEIAIRMALGAGASDVVRLMVQQTARVIGVGLAIGAAMVLLAGRALGALLFGLQPTDPVSLGAGVSALAIVGLAAAYVPAARAGRMSPLDGLRAE